MEKSQIVSIKFVKNDYLNIWELAIIRQKETRFYSNGYVATEKNIQRVTAIMAQMMKK